jgi:hemoglobin-like flavoprotein
MFPDDMRHQAVMLRIAVKGVLEHLEEPDWLEHVLGSLGARHAAWGVTEAMYSEFAECLLSAMAETAGEDWTPGLARGWSHTLEDITELMLASDPSTR